MPKRLIEGPQPSRRGYEMDFNIDGVLVELTCKNETTGEEMPEMDTGGLRTTMPMWYDIAFNDSVGIERAADTSAARTRIIGALGNVAELSDISRIGAKISWKPNEGMDTLNQLAEALSNMERTYLTSNAGHTWAKIHNPAGLIIMKLMQDESLHLTDHLNLQEIKNLERSLARTGIPPKPGILQDIGTEWADLRHDSDQAKARRELASRVETILSERINPLLERAGMPDDIRVNIIAKMNRLVFNHFTTTGVSTGTP